MRPVLRPLGFKTSPSSSSSSFGFVWFGFTGVVPETVESARLEERGSMAGRPL